LRLGGFLEGPVVIVRWSAMGNAPMKKSPFKSEHKARKVTCEKCGETYDRVFYERIHKEVCTGNTRAFTSLPRSK